MRLMGDPLFEGTPDLVSDEGPVLLDFATQIIQCLVSGPMPRNRYLVMISPAAHMNMENDATLGVVRDIQWEDRAPIFCSSFFEVRLRFSPPPWENSRPDPCC